MFKLLERTLVNRAYQLTRTLLFPARAETVESTTSTVEDGGQERLWSGCEPKKACLSRPNTFHSRCTKPPSSRNCKQHRMGELGTHGISTRNRCSSQVASTVLVWERDGLHRFYLRRYRVLQDPHHKRMSAWRHRHVRYCKMFAFK